MSNRVDELETKVKELQAAVNGLTEELVESKERIRQLENAVDVDDPAVRAKAPAQETSAPAEPQETAETKETEATEATDAAEPEPESAEPEQRFVDAEEHEPKLDDDTPDEEAKAEEAKNEEEAESESGSDIIVA